MALDPQLHSALLAMLQNAYSEPAKLDTFLGDNWGKELSEFAPDSLARPEKYSRLIRRIYREGWGLEFVERLREAFPDNDLAQNCWQLFNEDQLWQTLRLLHRSLGNSVIPSIALIIYAFISAYGFYQWTELQGLKFRGQLTISASGEIVQPSLWKPPGLGIMLSIVLLLIGWGGFSWLCFHLNSVYRRWLAAGRNAIVDRCIQTLRQRYPDQVRMWGGETALRSKQEVGKLIECFKRQRGGRMLDLFASCRSQLEKALCVRWTRWTKAGLFASVIVLIGWRVIEVLPPVKVDNFEVEQLVPMLGPNPATQQISIGSPISFTGEAWSWSSSIPKELEIKGIKNNKRCIVGLTYELNQEQWVAIKGHNIKVLARIGVSGRERVIDQALLSDSLP